MIRVEGAALLNTSGITATEVTQFIELFYRGSDSNFLVVRIGKTHPKFSGSCQYILKRNTLINMFTDCIEHAFASKIPFGGNLHVPPTMRAAYFMVLAHEIQHANQYLVHAPNSAFFTQGTYRRRACERDARKFVDDNIDLIWDYAGCNERRIRLQDHRVDAWREVEWICDMMTNEAPVEYSDVIRELGKKGLNNTVCQKIALEILEQNQVLILNAPDSHTQSSLSSPQAAAFK